MSVVRERAGDINRERTGKCGRFARKLHCEPPAGERDSGDAKVRRTAALLTVPPLPMRVFDMPRDAQAFAATRTLEVPGRIGGKATITIALRRAGAGR